MGLFDGLFKGLKPDPKSTSKVDDEIKQMRDLLSSSSGSFGCLEEDKPSPSWGPKMPDEENQFNYPGTYLEYFTKIFETEFPEYTIECSTGTGRRPVTVFTFWDGFKKALVVELLSQSSDVRKQRNICAKQGIPYLRYYYDHKGWWNTRSYVISRTRAALNG